jgi:hypothetical protein
MRRLIIVLGVVVAGQAMAGEPLGIPVYPQPTLPKGTQWIGESTPSASNCIDPTMDPNHGCVVKLPEFKTNWKLLIRMKNGDVSLIKDLTKSECERAKFRIESAECFE